jgi:hypothetical protein
MLLKLALAVPIAYSPQLLLMVVVVVVPTTLLLLVVLVVEQVRVVQVLVLETPHQLALRREIAAVRQLVALLLVVLVVVVLVR